MSASPPATGVKPPSSSSASSSSASSSSKNAVILPDTSKYVSPNDDLPAFKIFSFLIVATIVVKMVFQYVYQEPKSGKRDLTDVSLLGDTTQNKPGLYFKSYIMYYVAIFWTLCLLITVISMSLNKYGLGKCLAKMTLTNTLPIIALLIVLGVIVSQNYLFFKKINSPSLPNTYVVFDTGSNILLLFQAAVIFVLLKQQMLCDSEKSTYSENIVKYGPFIGIFLALLNGICLGITYVILKYYITDG